MKYSYYTLGKERADACLQRIRERLKDTDTERVAKAIVDQEVMVTCREAPFTINMLDEMFESDQYEFGNGWIIDALQKRLDEVNQNPAASLPEKTKVILSTLKACIYGNVTGEIWREVNNVERPLLF